LPSFIYFAQPTPPSARRTTGYPNRENFFLHYGDLTDLHALVAIIRDVRPTEVYNLAAQSHVQAGAVAVASLPGCVTRAVTQTPPAVINSVLLTIRPTRVVAPLPDVTRYRPTRVVASLPGVASDWYTEHTYCPPSIELPCFDRIKINVKIESGTQPPYVEVSFQMPMYTAEVDGVGTLNILEVGLLHKLTRSLGNRSTYQAKPFYLSSETVLPIT
jgi:hypothetical protein